MATYPFRTIEAKWQARWLEQQTFRVTTDVDVSRPKYYVLAELPYLGEKGVHAGAMKRFVVADVVARYKRMCGFNVLLPMGWDAFAVDVQAEATARGTHPRAVVEERIGRVREQLMALGLSYDWKRELNTAEPGYYRWTQWIFKQLFERGLVLQKDVPAWQCPELRTSLLNEKATDELAADARSQHARKVVRRWVLDISAFADALLHGFDDVKTLGVRQEKHHKWLERALGVSRDVEGDGDDTEQAGSRRVVWIISREQPWAEPIPVVFVDGEPRGVPDVELPVLLPDSDADRAGDDSDEEPRSADAWVDTVDGLSGRPARRETGRMPEWAGRSWFWLRSVDPYNRECVVDKAVERYWLPVDLFLFDGHSVWGEYEAPELLQARVVHRLLHDAGIVSMPEPFCMAIDSGPVTILSEATETEELPSVGGARVRPASTESIVERFGADALRLSLTCETFGWGDVSQHRTTAVEAMHRFLNRTWMLVTRETSTGSSSAIQSAEPTYEQLRALHWTIARVTSCFESLRFHEALRELMEFAERAKKWTNLPRTVDERFVLLLAPFAPHMAEELWERLGFTESLAFQPWPEADPAYAKPDALQVVVQVDGKRRGEVRVAVGAPESEVIDAARADRDVARHLEGKAILRTVYVPGRIVNFVTQE